MIRILVCIVIKNSLVFGLKVELSFLLNFYAGLGDKAFSIRAGISFFIMNKVFRRRNLDKGYLLLMLVIFQTIFFVTLIALLFLNWSYL